MEKVKMVKTFTKIKNQKINYYSTYNMLRKVSNTNKCNMF